MFVFMRHISYCIAAFAALTLASCQSREDQEIDTGREMTFSASFGEAGTRTQIDGSDKTKILWSPKDAIKVFCTDQASGKFESGNDEAADVTTFTGRMEPSAGGLGQVLGESEYWGVYPYSDDSEYDSGSVSLTVPSEQVAENGTFQRGAFPSVAVSKNPSLAFYNVCGGLCFTVSRADITSVTFEGKNNETLAGKVWVRMNESGRPEVKSVDEGAKSSVRLSMPEGKCFVPGVSYYLCALPQTLSEGFRMTLCTAAKDEGIYEHGPVTIDRSVFGAMTEVDKRVPGWENARAKGFDETKIELSVAVVSDVHVNGEKYATKWRNALTQLKAKALEQDNDGLDAVIVAGDLIDTQGSTVQLGQFKSAFEAEIDPEEIPLIYTVGNHDAQWAAGIVSNSKFMRDFFGEKYFGTDLDQDMRNNYEARHCVVGNYHILCVTPNGITPIAYDTKALQWLDSQLAAIAAADPERYILVITHPMVTGTVYGSLLGESDGIWSSANGHFWASSILTSILNKYPQVMIFGGHLHFPLNDPRSVWQGDYSAFGCGSVRYMAIENGHFEDMKSATVMNDCEQFSQGYLLQFDANGNGRLFRMDFYNNAIIGEPLVLDYPTSDKAHLAPYRHTTRSLANAAPTLSTLSVTIASNGTYDAGWEAGKDDEFVHHYVLTLRKEGALVKTWNILADFYLHPQTSQMKDEWTQSIGQLESGSYSLELRAYDSWNAESEALVKTFFVGSDMSVWTDDNAGTKKIDRGSGSVSSDWLSYSDGTVSWQANTTGRPRVASLTLPDGGTYTCTQLSVADFKGEWNFTSKIFAGTVSPIHKDKNPGTLAVNVGNPRATGMLTAADGKTYVNNIGISGLYGSAVLDACVQIDYAAMTAKVGLLLDTRDGVGQKVNGKYVTFFPGLATLTSSSWGKPWLFYETEQGNPDFTYLWLTLQNDLKTLMYKNRVSADVQMQILTQYKNKKMNAICGFGVAASNTNVFNNSTITAYSNFFQFNPTGYDGLQFVLE